MSNEMSQHVRASHVFAAAQESLLKETGRKLLADAVLALPKDSFWTTKMPDAASFLKADKLAALTKWLQSFQASPCLADVLKLWTF